MPARTIFKDGPHPVDVHVGQRLRMRRTLLGMSQGKVADALGNKYQQIQKFEGGTNRIGPSGLLALSQILHVPVSFFFEDMQTIRNSRNRVTDGKPETGPDPVNEPETLAFVRAYYRIKDPAIRHSIAEMTKAIGR
ncbi:MAG: helix-turn-helix transcriptional regulator [Candidatus Tectomicrobia bacterium]